MQTRSFLVPTRVDGRAVHKFTRGCVIGVAGSLRNGCLLGDWLLQKRLSTRYSEIGCLLAEVKRLSTRCADGTCADGTSDAPLPSPAERDR
jgi:hypothetical protein